MAIVSDEIMETIKKFLGMVSENGLHIERAIVFGSYAKGKQNEWSDIDIAMVSKDFTGVRFYDRKRLNPYLIRVDSRIEPRHFVIPVFPVNAVRAKFPQATITLHWTSSSSSLSF